MVVKIRLARFGRANDTMFNIVVAQARSAQRKPPIEVIGTYNPKPQPENYEGATGVKTGGLLHKDIQLDVVRAKYWVGVGAQPTDTVWRILSMAGVLEPKKKPHEV